MRLSDLVEIFFSQRKILELLGKILALKKI